MVQLTDTLTLDKDARICADGCLVAEVFAARTGIQDYLGREVDPENKHGLRDKAVVKVYRPESEVFKTDSLATFAAAPVTVDHPSEAVTADNWRALGVGEINGDIARDGQRVRVPIIVRDAAAVKAATTTHKQLSMGYATDLQVPADGKHPDGTVCDAYQTNIRINHIALVRAARGGPELRVVDERTAQTSAISDSVQGAISYLKKAIALHEKHMNGTAPTTGPDGVKSQRLMMKQMENALSELEPDSSGSSMEMDHFKDGVLPMKIKIGDAEVDATNGEAVRIAVDALQTKHAATAQALKDAEAKVVEHTATITAKDAKIADLEQQVADSAITPAKLADAAKEFADVQAKAKALGVTFAEDADAAAIRKAVVAAKMGDAAKDYSDEHVAIAFDALTKDAKVDPVRKALADGRVAQVTDLATVRNLARAAQY